MSQLSKTEMAARIVELEAQLKATQEQLAAVGTQGRDTVRTALPTWGGHSCTGLIRAFTHLGYAPGTINRILVGIGIVCSPATISTQRQHAKKGKAGATLTTSQVEVFRLMATGQAVPDDQMAAAKQPAVVEAPQVEEQPV